jgi:hypothetical protein
VLKNAELRTKFLETWARGRQGNTLEEQLRDVKPDDWDAVVKPFGEEGQSRFSANRDTVYGRANYLREGLEYRSDMEILQIPRLMLLPSFEGQLDGVLNNALRTIAGQYSPRAVFEMRKQGIWVTPTEEAMYKDIYDKARKAHERLINAATREQAIKEWAERTGRNGSNPEEWFQDVRSLDWDAVVFDYLKESASSSSPGGAPANLPATGTEG